MYQFEFWDFLSFVVFWPKTPYTSSWFLKKSRFSRESPDISLDFGFEEVILSRYQGLGVCILVSKQLVQSDLVRYWCTSRCGLALLPWQNLVLQDYCLGFGYWTIFFIRIRSPWVCVLGPIWSGWKTTVFFFRVKPLFKLPIFWGFLKTGHARSI